MNDQKEDEGLVKGLAKRISDLEQELLLARKSAQESEERYRRALFDRSFYGVFILDLSGNVLDANDVGLDMLGYGREHVRELNFWDLLPEDQVAQASAAREDLLKAGVREKPLELKFRHRDGSLISLETTSALLYREGEPYAVQGIVRNISERKQAEEDFEKSERFYRTIFENTGSASILIAEDTTILLANTNFIRLTGYEREEVEGKMSWTSFIEPEDLERMKNYHFLRRRSPSSAPGSYEFRFITRSGELRHIFLTVALIPGTKESIASCMDITERKRAEQELRIREGRFRSLIQNLSDLVMILDRDGLFIYETPSVERILHYPAGYLIGRSPMDFIHSDDIPFVQKELGEVYRMEGDGQPAEFRVKRFDGAWVYLEAIGTNLIHYPGIGGVVITARDVTERKKAEEALHESEERYRNILDNMQEAYYEVDLKGNFTYFNASAVERLGYADEEMQGMNFRTFVDRENARRVFETYHKVFLAGEPVKGFDWEAISKAGERFWVAASVSLMRDDRGVPVGFRGIVRDVTERKKAEEALHGSEERYRNILDNMQEAYYEVDLKGNFTYFNLPAITRLGYTEEEMKNMNYRRFTDEENIRKLYEAYHNVYLTGNPVTGIEWDVINKYGEKIPVEASVSLKCDEAGNPVGFRGIVRDVTDRRKAQDALRRSEEKYRTIFEHTATANVIVDENHVIRLANSKFEKLTGYAKKELEGKTVWTSFVAEKDLKRMKKYHSQRLRKEGPVPDAYEFRCVVRSGEARDLFMSVAMIPGTNESVASIIDITDRKKAEEALRQSEERFRDMARLMPETVFEIDERGIITFANETAFEKFQYAPEELDKGLAVTIMVASEDRARAIEDIGRVLAGERIGLDEYLARRKDGTTFPVLVHTAAIMKNGRPSGARGFLIDISEKKILEEQFMRAQKMEAIGTMAGGIAHDFNNLLMGILGNVSLMLLSADKSHPFFDRLKNVEEYVRQGSELTKRFLGFARGGKYEVRPTRLGEFIQKSAEMFGRTKKEIRIHQSVQEGLWVAEVDRNQMEQVMLNLFVNAWQAMPGGGELYLSTRNVNLDESEAAPFGVVPGRYVRVSVADTGVGMDEEVRSRIFEPFFTTKGKGRGTGLGLASVYGIVKNHKGFITVESEKGAGSTFTLYLPATGKTVQEERQTCGVIRKGQGTILLIDDEEIILDVGSEMLKRLGYAVITAAGGRAGIEAYRDNRDSIDLVVLDMIMPDLGGKDTFDGLREIRPDVNVLLSSGYSLNGQAKEIMDKGCKGFIHKPFSLGELAERIREILDGGMQGA